ncbi:hypothetical protein BS78_06G104200 [Paspalum vaginatum]|nr:hypothetical protein BS78_06G104200 [Paspalum vaginatum]
MEAHGKRKRDDYSGGDTVCLGNGDRLSDLPDCLLHEIMSRMKAREAVQTCVLSRRWRHLWRSIPCLDVDQGEFKVAGARLADIHTAWDKFEEFAVILLRKVSIALLDTFRLHVTPDFYGDTYSRSASGWIRREIKYGGIIPREGLISYTTWRLKKLHLSNVSPLDELFAEHVRSGCPSLEHLELRSCRCEFRAINSNSLKNLVLRRCESKEFSEIASPTLQSLVFDGGSIRCPFVISAPAVAYLFLVVSPYTFKGGVAVHEMASIAKASIHPNLIVEDSNQLKGDLFKLLRSVSNATSLELLAGSDVTVLGEESATFPEFKNLRNLELNGCNLSSDLQVSGHVLWNSPNLEMLTLSPSCWKALGEGSFSYPELNTMRVLILDNYDPRNGLQPLQRLLRSSPVLEKLTLRCRKVRLLKR